MVIDWWKCLQECESSARLCFFVFFSVSIKSMMNDSCSILYYLVVQWFFLINWIINSN